LQLIASNHAYMTSTESSPAAVAAWFTQRLPEEWTAPAAADVTVDREEITVILTLTAPETAEGATDAEKAEGIAGLVARFREDTRERRIAIAREAEHRFRRKVAWGVRVGDRRELFTHLAVPVMTRLRQPERQVLDTLVEAGVARSRAHALAWCVRLVGENTSTWLGDLRNAMERVEQVRNAGPTGSSDTAAE
jgi:hypothetical protein